MDIVQNNESQFNVEELEQRLEMTAAAAEMQAAPSDVVVIFGITWTF